MSVFFLKIFYNNRVDQVC